ncbi:MAG TPA: cupin domain-containing protein [Balneolales bacterium]|nr:cupin domain-containing protein [Balneolales bacterium]
MEIVNLDKKFSLFNEYWQPKLVGELNGQHIKIAKLKGEFIWHKHDNEDEMFLIHKGQLIIKLRDRDVTLNKGEFFIVPKGVEHKPVAEEEVHLIMFEPAQTRNTGNVENEKTVETIERI